MSTTTALNVYFLGLSEATKSSEQAQISMIGQIVNLIQKLCFLYLFEGLYKKPHDRVKDYCAENPDALECRIYED